MSASIIALGRSDSHALLAPHARSLGVEYEAIEGYEVAEHLRDLASGSHGSLTSRIATFRSEGPVILAAIDSSITAGMLRSFALHMEKIGFSQISLRSDPQLLEKLSILDVIDKREGKELQEEDPKTLLLLSIARSPHGQVAIWPIISISHEGTISHLIEAPTEVVDQTLEKAITEIAKISLVGVLTYVIDPEDGAVVRREFGLARVTFWSESASYTSVSEQIIRSILDLPLGDVRMIDYEEYFLEEEIDVARDLIKDPIRPFLHLFARNPRLKVRYLFSHQFHVRSGDHTGDPSQIQQRDGVSDGIGVGEAEVRTSISLFGSTEDEARTELAHARDFMLGR